MSRRKQERKYWDGFRDALVVGHPDPGLPETGIAIAEDPYYRRGFKDGERAVERIRYVGPEDAIVPIHHQIDRPEEGFKVEGDS